MEGNEQQIDENPEICCFKLTSASILPCNGNLLSISSLPDIEKCIIYSVIKVLPSKLSEGFQICNRHLSQTQSEYEHRFRRKECGVASFLGSLAVHTTKTRGDRHVTAESFQKIAKVTGLFVPVGTRLFVSSGPVIDGRFKQKEIQRSPTAEELFEASSLFEADDEITEMIEKMVHSILFDDVLDELKETSPLTDETKRSSNTDTCTLTEPGLTHLQESNSDTTRKEFDKRKDTEPNRTSEVLQEMSREMISKSYEALRVNISEVCQKRATEYSLSLLNEFLQDSYADLSNDICELLLYVIELFHKEVLEFGNELVESLLRNFDKGAQSFSYGLVSDLLNWYDDGFVQDVGEMNAEFEEHMREFTESAKQNLMPLCDSKIKRYGGLLGKAIEVRLQSAADHKATNERNKDADEIATELKEAENGLWGKETGVNLQEADGLKISRERNADSNELDEVENGLLEKETNTTDIQACQERTDSNEASAELDNAENKKDDTSTLELDIPLPAITEEKDKGKKYSLKRLWRGVKKIFCCCVSVAERN